MQMKMGKAAPVAALLAVLCLLFGCEQYTPSERSRQIDAGRRLMQDYLDAYIPGGRILTIDVHDEALPGQGTQRTLTEYVVGTYSDPDGSWWFEVNTETGELYSSKTFERLEQLIGEGVLRELGLGDDCTVDRITTAHTLLPHRCEQFGHNIDSIRIFADPETSPGLDTIYFQNVTPIAMVDAEGFYAREDRQTLYVEGCRVLLPEGVVEPETEGLFPLEFDGVVVYQVLFARGS